jgi:hypothetical protein
LAALFLLALAQSPASASPAAAPTVTDGGITNNFPEGIVFSVHARDTAGIQTVRLLYEILPDGTSAIARPEFTPGPTVDAEVVLETNSNPRLYLPPGTVIVYHWEVTNTAGEQATTPERTFFYDDTRFSWKELSGDGVTVYYYSGSDGDAAAMHDVALQTISDAEALLGATVPFDVQVRIYENEPDMEPALRRRSPTFESQTIIEGVRVASNAVFVLGNAAFDTLRHELTHVVTALAGESPLGILPAWLDEGTAVYFQEEPGGYASAIKQGLSRGEVLSIREISAPPGESAKVGLFYGESWSLVSFLIDNYGPEKFAQLFAGIKAGDGVDETFAAVYGFDQDGLENAWRSEHGLPPHETPAPTTPAPTGASGGANGEDGGAGTGTIAAIIIGIIGLAVIVGVAGVMIGRRL